MFPDQYETFSDQILDNDHNTGGISSDDDNDDEYQSLHSNNSSVNDDSCLSDDLAELIVDNFVSRNFVNKLLVLLHKYHNDLPTDYRALLQTPKKRNLTDVAGEHFMNFSIQDELSFIQKGSELRSFTIDTNVDGMPVGKSSTLTFDVITSMVNAVVKCFVTSILN